MGETDEERWALEALCPLDGRYRGRVAKVRAYFSEAALIKYRVRVEVEYLLALDKVIATGSSVLKSESAKAKWRDVYEKFGPVAASRVKAIEAVTNHDVKAVEYYLKEQWDALFCPEDESDSSASKCREFIHFGLTSQDVNHVAQPLALLEFHASVFSPKLRELVAALNERAVSWKDVGMLARTHGQAATPTRLGKEFGVFAARLKKCVDALDAVPATAKFGGATGGFNAHFVAYPEIDWPSFADDFVASFGLTRQQYTTQIENYDDLAAYCHAVARCNTVVLDLCRDCWQYVSLGYFRQLVIKGEVGSSAMPHKVNPIDFENAEGNLGVANASLLHLAQKLPVSRLQRDLSDSTVLRTLGVPLGHAYLAIGAVLKGLSKLALDPDALAADLDANWAVVAEAIQTVLRREHFPQPYEALKALTRGKKSITQADFLAFIDQLPLISDAVKSELKAISPHTFLGRFDPSPFSASS